jgi:5-methylcytosine-specific restriction endonuclease McrA
MTFREELIRAKRKIKEEREYKLVCEQRLANGLSLNDIPLPPVVNKQHYYNKHNRSDQWPRLRKSFLIANDKCVFCGLKDINIIQAHHIMPFCLYPTLELNKDNLITICGTESDACHRDFGHPLGTQSYNPDIKKHAKFLKENGLSRYEEVKEMAKLSAWLI